MALPELIPLADPVALRKESVDRNFGFVECLVLHGLVALRKESVDRNVINKSNIRHRSESLSARRAWIEIGNPRKKP